MRSSRPSRHWRGIDRRRWRIVRRQVLERDGYRCRQCGRAGRLECDHRVPMHVAPDQDPYDLAGLQTLCRGCHIAKTTREAAAANPPGPERRAWADLLGQLRE